MYRIGIDVGGTFTDLVAVDGAGRVVIAKTASTPRDPSDGLLAGLELLAVELGTDLRGLLAATERIVHGTTVATNALLERKGDRTVLVTTRGFRDALRIGYQNRPRLFDRHIVLHDLLYERVIEASERVGAGGEVALPLDGEALLRRFESAGFADLFHAPSAGERDELAQGKLPRLDGTLVERVPLDTHYSLLANADFARAQDEIDEAIAKRLDEAH